MIYKLFLFGDNQVFAYTEIFNDIFLKEGDLFYFQGKRYKILRVTRVYLPIEFDGGQIKRHRIDTPNKEFIDEFGPELIITEIPTT